MTKNIASTVLPSERTEVMSHSVSLKNSHHEVANAETKSDALRSVTELAKVEEKVVLAKVLEERKDKFEALKVTMSQSGATLLMMRNETSSTVDKLRSEGDSALALHKKLLLAIRLMVKSQKERKDKAADTSIKLRKIYVKGRKIMVEPHVAE